jgi:hypothetical protein
MIPMKKTHHIPRKIPFYGKANWETVKKDLDHIPVKMLREMELPISSLCDTFQSSLEESIQHSNENSKNYTDGCHGSPEIHVD